MLLSDAPNSLTRPHTQPEIQQALDFDLVIVGGGLVGATLAAALRASNLRVAVIEARSESAAVARGQAYHINLMSSRIFQGIGIWDSIQAQSNPIDQICLSDQNYPGVVPFTVADLGTAYLGTVSEHRVLLEALQTCLQQAANIAYLCPAELIETNYLPDRVELTLKQPDGVRQVQTRLLVAADGARSPIRAQAGIQTVGWQYWQACVVAFIQPERSHQNVAYERFWAAGPFAILPLPNNLCRIVWTAPKAEAEAIVALPESEFLAQLTQRYGNQMGKLTLVGDRSMFPVRLMQSQQYVRSRLALIGDAAHCCHPVGGQGVNLGIRDAAALAEVLQTAHQQGQDIGDLKVLRRYGRWRKVENLVILAFTDVLDRVFSTDWLPLVVARRAGLELMRHVPPLRQAALRLMTGLLGRVPQLAKR